MSIDNRIRLIDLRKVLTWAPRCRRGVCVVRLHLGFMKTPRFLNARSKTITSAAAILSLSAFLSGVLGLVRNKILAHLFGAGDVVDIYTSAFRIPDLVFTILVAGFLSAGFIPVFTSYLEKKSESDAWEFAGNVLNILLIFLAGLSLVLLVLAPVLLKWLLPGFSPEKLQKTLEITRILFLSPIILGVSRLFGDALKSLRHFLVVAIAPILYNIGIIIGIVWFYPLWGLQGLAVGVIFGALLNLLVQVPTIGFSGFRPNWKVNFKDSGFKRIVRLAPLRSLALIVNQVNLFVVTSIASTLTAGSVAVFYNFAKPLQDFPITIFGMSFAIAAFPTLSLMAARKDWTKLAENFSNTFRQIVFFLVPSSALLFILRAQIVRLLYGSGAFDWPATIKTLDTVGLFAISMIAQGLILLLLRSFYALENTKTPLLGSLVLLIVNIVSSLALAPSLGVKGLALALTLGSFAQFLFLWLTLRGRLPILRTHDRGVAISVLKVLGSSLVAALATREALYLMDPYVNTYTGVGVLSQTIVASVVGIGFYVVISLLLRSPELGAIKKLFTNGNREETL